jgi:hypothetical protein
MVYAYLQGQTGVFTQQMGSMSVDIHESKTNAASALRDVNDRLYASQFDKGQLSQTITDFRARLKEVDEKQLTATTALSLRIDERAKSIDDKITLAGQLQQKANDAAYISRDEMASWRLAHVKENAYSQGLVDAKIDALTGEVKTLEERQYEHRVGHIDNDDIDDIQKQAQLMEERQQREEEDRAARHKIK